MKRLKDFIYDYNDVLVALLIVVVAGFIIFWRVNVVMNYAEYAGGTPIKQIDINFSDIDLNPEDVDPETNPITENNDDNPNQGQEVTSTSAIEPNTPPAVEPVDPQPPVEPPKTEPKKFSLEVSKAAGTTNWTACGKKLEAAGVITSSKDFISRVTERKVESQLQLGTFELSADMSLDKIIDIMIKK